MPSALDHESFDITLHRKDSEGFGFVILTSKSKPPYGGECCPHGPRMDPAWTRGLNQQLHHDTMNIDSLDRGQRMSDMN